MFSKKDIIQIHSHNIPIKTVLSQIKRFESGFPFINLQAPATIGNGIIKLSSLEIKELVDLYDKSIIKGIKVSKFVPASGAASRMFNSLFEARLRLKKGESEEEILKGEVINTFFSQLKKFAFYEDLKKMHKDLPEQLSLETILDDILLPEKLGYGILPKGLIAFHKYPEKARIPFEEHCVEGALYAKNADNSVPIHFTVSHNHIENFKNQIQKIRDNFGKSLNADFRITLSEQMPCTDTIAATTDNKPFRNSDGSMLFRPGGHGSLLNNLNNPDSDIVFIKNIDNVAPDHLKADIIKYNKVLAGLLLKTQKEIFRFQAISDNKNYKEVDNLFITEASEFLNNTLKIQIPENFSKKETYEYIKKIINRPIRVCGMVINEDEPGGGPFWTLNKFKEKSLQIVELSQIDIKNPRQKEILSGASHFNPVDLVCSFKNYKGVKYNLQDFRDNNTGFISIKFQDGIEIKVQELPGLWNGSMSEWNTLFVEIPLNTFSPVKTFLDLLRKEHQPKD
ncbi:MAG: DUF4301 family protein [Prolixibacteraceae bacterium]|nr:DUF4301 family protein [Prolixibacteraceae bacterium]